MPHTTPYLLSSCVVTKSDDWYLLKSYTPVSCIHVLLYSCTPVFMYSCTPVILYSCTPTLLHSYTPTLLHSKLLKVDKRKNRHCAVSERVWAGKDCELNVTTFKLLSTTTLRGQWWWMSRQHEDVSDLVVRTHCLTLNSLWRILRGEWKGGVMLVLDSVGSISGQPAGPTQIFRLEILWRVNWCFVTCHISFCFTPAT